jgi:hypothetical protein
MRDPELVTRAQQAAVRLESAWDRWRTLHGLAEVPVQPVASYVGYSLKEPWGQPRVVIGVDAYEAEYLAAFLESHQCGQPGQVTYPLGQPAVASGAKPGEGPDQGQFPPEQIHLAGQAGVSDPGGYSDPVGYGDPAGYPGPEIHAAPVPPLAVAGSPPTPGPDSADAIAAELAGWGSGELPGQASEQLASWTSGLTAAASPHGPTTTR